MGATTKVKVNKTSKPRKVTFTVKTVKGVRRFTPVNKRAKAFATVIGGKSLEAKHLKNIKKAGFSVCESPSLKTIKL